MTTPVDVVVLTWNDGALLDEAVASALASEDVSVTVTVVDNGSDPPATVVGDPRVRLIRNDANAGVAPGRNQGVRATAAPYVCLLDSDAQLQPLALQALVEPFTIDPDIAVAGPVFTDQAPEASGGRAPTLARKAARMLNLRDTYAPAPGTGTGRWWDVDFVIGACQLVRRTAFDAVGGLDEGYFYGPEDVDFCLRLRRARWRVVQVAAARVDHPPRRRHKRAVTLAGVRHGLAVARHHWRHRGFRSAVGS